nr:farnesyl diphosphate synthase [Caldalkalibacillus salinus]
MKEQQQMLDEALKESVERIQAPADLVDSMKYSLLAGGKRIRPIFLLATLSVLGVDLNKGKEAACAVEMIHTYSLIHDDLPAMDDDDYRRGQLTNHKVYGEGMAILAGDGLLTHAFHVLTNPSHDVKPHIIVDMVNELSRYAGPAGMVGGQVADIQGEEKSLTPEELRYIHEHKTADLIVCAVRLGAILAETSQEKRDDLTQFARHIGLAFQIQDDILDEVGDEKKLGKQVGSDRENKKTTYVSLYGLEQARAFVASHIKQAQDLLTRIEPQSDILFELSEFMVARES